MHSESLPRLTTPHDHGAILAYPPLTEAGSLRAANARHFDEATIELQGWPLQDLRTLARDEVLDAARHYLAEAGEPVPDFVGNSVFLAGHQPDLFHPGVWVKNFALQRLARQHRAVPLNLVVDNDAAKPALLRLPHAARQLTLPFDRSTSDVPYEDRHVLDEELFASFPERAANVIGDWPFRPLLADFWNDMVRQRSRTSLLGERIAAARRVFERAWGLEPLEVPLSRICQTDAFAWFAVHLLRELPRFHADYNRAVRTYRSRHGLQSQQHPVPDLAQDDAWLEAPFWCWGPREPRRQRVWAKMQGKSLLVRGGSHPFFELPSDVTDVVTPWRQLACRGLKVRTRALTTTLFCRLLVGDLFIHGIGGGKYDEVTDELFRQFFGLMPPTYLVLTATLHLPLEKHPSAANDVRRLQQLHRDLRWNPQRHLNGSPDAQGMAAEKLAWIARASTTSAERQARFTKLRQVNERLGAFTALEAERTHQALAVAERRHREHELHSARDYAFCLFPEDMLRPFYQHVLTNA